MTVKQMRNASFYLTIPNPLYLTIPNPPVICNTSGKGIWSNRVCPVAVSRVKISISDWSDDGFDWPLGCRGYVAIDAYFSKKSWNTSKHGLIYTDPKWIKEFNKQMKAINPDLFCSEIDYTEQGMQGDNFVSLQMSPKNIKQFERGLRRNIK